VAATIKAAPRAHIRYPKEWCKAPKETKKEKEGGGLRRVVKPQCRKRSEKSKKQNKGGRGKREGKGDAPGAGALENSREGAL